VPGEHRSGNSGRRGFVIGELLVAVLLLAVAVSSLAALMYSVSRRPEARESAACVGKSTGAPRNCVTRSIGGGPSKLLRPGCATKTGTAARECNESLVPNGDSSDETIVRARTDSASLALLAKKKEEHLSRRPDRGFIR
jgi:hypothetical protein